MEIINATDGIVNPDFKQLFKNLGYLCDPGMVATDKTILDLICKKTEYHCKKNDLYYI